MAFNRPLNTHILKSSLPEGEHRVRIIQAEDAISRSSGLDMIKLTMQVENSNVHLTQYIVDNEYADEAIIKIFRSCNTQLPNLVNSASFRGLVGRVKTRNTIYNGDEKPEIHYWLKPLPESEAVPPPEATQQEALQEATTNSADNIPF